MDTILHGPKANEQAHGRAGCHHEQLSVKRSWRCCRKHFQPDLIFRYVATMCTTADGSLMEEDAQLPFRLSRVAVQVFLVGTFGRKDANVDNTEVVKQHSQVGTWRDAFRFPMSALDRYDNQLLRPRHYNLPILACGKLTNQWSDVISRLLSEGQFLRARTQTTYGDRDGSGACIIGKYQMN